MQPEKTGRIGSDRWTMVALVLLVAVAYFRTPSAGFVWDDSQHVIGAGFSSFHGLWRIWTEPGATQQYYPVTYTAFWLQWQLWRDAPAGYHIVNALLHAAVVCLLYRALRRLAVPGAALGAALFAVHPVGVETVAWVSEQKNTLSAVLYFSAGLAYWRFARDRAAASYALASALFLAAILAKSVTATLPAALLVIAWWQRGRLEWRRDVLPLAPWAIVGAAMGRVTAWMEQTYVGRGGMGYHLTAPERVLIAGRAIWFYLGKLVIPRHLTFIYPRWVLAPSDPAQWLAPLAAVAVIGGLWAMRSKSRGPVTAALLYVGTLVPALGFVDVFPFLYSFVADHFQYLAAALALPAIGAGLTWLAQRLSMPRIVRWTLAGAAMLALSLMTIRRTADFHDSPTLWRATLALNSGSWMAYNNLGTDLLVEGQVAAAIASIQSSLRLKPDNAVAHVNLADALRQQGDGAGAEREYQQALRLDPANIVGQANYGVLLYDEGRNPEAIDHLRAALAVRPDYAVAQGDLGDALMSEGLLDDAVAAYRRALNEAPDVHTLTNCGTALMRLGRPAEGIAAYEAAIGMDPGYAVARLDLGNALLRSDRINEAIDCYRTAIRLDPHLHSAHNNLGYALLRAGRSADALEQFFGELQIDPSVVAGDEGYALLQLGRTNEALAEFKRAMGSSP